MLSPPTQDYGKGDKFENYQLLPSFQEYILVYPNEPKVDIYYRKDPSKKLWMYHQVKGLDAAIKCTSIGCTLRLKDLYNNLPPIGT